MLQKTSLYEQMSFHCRMEINNPHFISLLSIRYSRKEKPNFLMNVIALSKANI